MVCHELGVPGKKAGGYKIVSTTPANLKDHVSTGRERVNLLWSETVNNFSRDGSQLVS